MYHGSIGHTVEIPLGRPAPPPPSEPDPWTPELRDRRADINTRVGIAAIEANIDYATDNQADLLANQLEWFRRGVAGEAARPIDDPLSLELACCEGRQHLPPGVPTGVRHPRRLRST
jgi:hypothetical protein